MKRAPRSPVGVVEATYAPARSEVGWLDGILDAAGPILSEGLGATAYFYDTHCGQMRIGARAAHELQYELDEFLSPIESLSSDFIDQTWCSLSFGVCSEIFPMSTLPEARALHDAGIRDVANINAYDGAGNGVCLSVPMSAERRQRPGEAETWSRVAAHMGSALRLMQRDRLAPSPETAAAVLTPKGRLEHAADGKTADRVRARLVEAVLRVERARGPMRNREPENAVGLWWALVDAEFTLLDYFERGGKRYVVAVANPPRDDARLSKLPRRERQVVAAAAAGRTNKLIAYELGLAQSTVRVLLARAARRLDAKSREELIAIYRAHDRARPAVSQSPRSLRAK